MDVCVFPGVRGAVVGQAQTLRRGQMEHRALALLGVCRPAGLRIYSLDLLQVIDVVARVELDQVPDGFLASLGVQAVMRVS